MHRRSFNPPMPGLVRIDRAILYLKQQLTKHIQLIERQNTKGLGEYVYNIQATARDMSSILGMSGYDRFADQIMTAIGRLSDRTPRKQAVEILQSLIAELDAHPSAQDRQDTEDAQLVRLESFEQPLDDGKVQKAHPLDTAKDKTVFVIMPFTAEFNDVWKGGILRAAKAQGFNPIRVDMINRSNNITDDIVESVEECRLAIVDVTGNNPNVMFELGYAVARSKPNIIISQSVNYLPFDIRNIRTIVYSNSWSGIEELRAKIQEFLQESTRAAKNVSKKEEPPTTDGK